MSDAPSDVPSAGPREGPRDGPCDGSCAAPRPVALVAVQASLHPDRYRSEAAYRAWVLDACERAVDGLPPAAEVPRLLAFPELIGAPLSWALDRPPDARDQDRALHRAWANVRERPGELARAAVRWRRLGLGLLHHLR
ncbi:MAG: hypothetical protein WD336_07065, partial [Trueperaceae bacterium]